jgi:hypothetical protein
LLPLPFSLAVAEHGCIASRGCPIHPAEANARILRQCVGISYGWQAAIRSSPPRGLEQASLFKWGYAWMTRRVSISSDGCSRTGWAYKWSRAERGRRAHLLLVQATISLDRSCLIDVQMSSGRRSGLVRSKSAARTGLRATRTSPLNPASCMHPSTDHTLRFGPWLGSRARGLHRHLALALGPGPGQRACEVCDGTGPLNLWGPNV